MEKKICFKCNSEKPITEFYTHKKMKDGHLNKCISCTKSDNNKLYRTKSSDYDFKKLERERCKLKYQKRKTQQKLITDIYKIKFPEKYSARIASQYIDVPDGFHRHHWSYLPDHQKDVIILSASDHRILHVSMIYDQERMMYRDLNGHLLDSKESHINLLQSIKNNFNE